MEPEPAPSQPIEDQNADHEQARARAWADFDRGDFAAAADAFLALAECMPLGEQELHALVETSKASGRDREAAAALAAWLARPAEIEDAIRLRWAEEAFALAHATGLAQLAESCGLALLESAAAIDDEAIWLDLVASGRLRAIEAAMLTPLALLDALEQESFAPEATGLPALAAPRIEELGRLHATDYVVARTAERWLHAAGLAPAAYRVERARRDIATAGSLTDDRAMPPELRLNGRNLVIVGGHPKLRARLRIDLRAAGANDVREIPSAKEASRLTRDVQAVMAGADVTVVIARQIAHSTFAQVKTAGARSGTPVISAQIASSRAVRRALELWLGEASS